VAGRSRQCAGHVSSVWYHTINKESATWAEKFQKLYGKLPENQAWCDYVGAKCILGAIAKAGSLEGAKIGQALVGFKIDCLKRAGAIFPRMG